MEMEQRRVVPKGWEGCVGESVGERKESTQVQD